MRQDDVVVVVRWGKGALRGYVPEEARDGGFVVLPRRESERRAGAVEAEGEVSGGSLVGREVQDGVVEEGAGVDSSGP